MPPLRLWGVGVSKVRRETVISEVQSWQEDWDEEMKMPNCDGDGGQDGCAFVGALRRVRVGRNGCAMRGIRDVVDLG